MGFASETDSAFSSPRAESARAITGRWCPHSGVGEDFLTRQPFFFYKNSNFSGTKSRKIDLRLRNWPSRQGLQTGHWQNPVSYSKNGFSGRNPNFWANFLDRSVEEFVVRRREFRATGRRRRREATSPPSTSRRIVSPLSITHIRLRWVDSTKCFQLCSCSGTETLGLPGGGAVQRWDLSLPSLRRQCKIFASG